MNIHTFEVEVNASGVARVKLAGLTLFTTDVSRELRSSAPTRHDEAESEAIYRFARRLKDALDATA